MLMSGHRRNDCTARMVKPSSQEMPAFPEPGHVAVVGGGPAGAFLAIHLLREARSLGRTLNVTVFEPRWAGVGTDRGPGDECWKGCNHCAGGLSPRIRDELHRIGVVLPDRLVQARIGTVTIQGYWKNIELEAPHGRELLSVYRGSYPARRADRAESFDAFLLGAAVRAGARVEAARVTRIDRDPSGRWTVCAEGNGSLTADFVALASGVNNPCPESVGASQDLIGQVLPDFRPPPRRRAMVFELELGYPLPGELPGGLHLVEYGSAELRLEMCSILPKRGFVTVVLVGPSVDAARGGADNRAILERFLALPHIGKLLPPRAVPRAACLCTPWMVAGTARHYLGDGVAAVGDLVTTRLNKDGILSACKLAEALAVAILRRGCDRASLTRAYAPAVTAIKRDNRYASCVFLLHRVVFSSSVLSRVLYQAVIHERKTHPVRTRRLERMLWRIASGEVPYRTVFWSMWHPSTLSSVLHGGLWITLRNYVTERIFGLDWEGFGRFTTGVALERFEAKRMEFGRWLMISGATVPGRLEFERMYTIRIAAPSERVFEQIGRFGETDRRFLRPRGLDVRRVAGQPNEPGCRVQYRVIHGRFRFHLEIERLIPGKLVVYRVLDGFARGGVLVFEVEPAGSGLCNLSIYVAFNFPRGKTLPGRLFWWAFRRLFPAFVHDVLWNHSLCQFKDTVSTTDHPGSGAVTAAAAGVSSDCPVPVES